MVLDNVIILVYILAMLGMGYIGYRRTKSQDDYLVAGRRLGIFMYSSTLSVVVLGGASLVGGIGLGYEFGISGAWLVTAIALGILVLSGVLAKRLTKLRIYTVTQMLDLRYGGSSAPFSGIVMFLYTFMLAVTSTLAYATVFHVLFGWENWAGILVGGAIVILYSSLGGMWSITITDFVQFVVMTVGVFVLLLPITYTQAGGWDAIIDRLGDSFASPTAIGGASIVTYIIVYTLGLLIGQDIWQRVFTARTANTARNGGLIAGVYILLFAIAGAIIGMAAHVLLPELAHPDDAFAAVVDQVLPHGLRGLVLAAGLATMMSTASGALIAASTVFTKDVLPLFNPKAREQSELVGASTDADAHLHGFRGVMLIVGAAILGTAMIMTSVVGALTIAYNILVAALLVPIVGGMLWQRANRTGAYAGIVAGAAAVIIGMFVWGEMANEPIYVGLGASLVAFLIGTAVGSPTSQETIDHWHERLAASDEFDLSTGLIDIIQAREANNAEPDSAAPARKPESNA
nr:sodium:solute symporter [Pseudoclavibacter sp. Marseille-Q3772]